jgi:ribosome maturation factor RimP
MTIDKATVERFIGRYVKIVTDNNFTFDGKIQGCFNNGVMLFSDNKTIFLGYSDIKEIIPITCRYDKIYSDYYQKG